MIASNAQLKAFVERIERMDEEIKASNDDKRDIYAEAKANGFDVKALKTVIARRRKDPHELSEHDAIVETYMAALESGTPIATRARTRGDAHPPTVDLPRPNVSNPPFALPAESFPEMPDELKRRHATV